MDICANCSTEMDTRNVAKSCIKDVLLEREEYKYVIFLPVLLGHSVHRSVLDVLVGLAKMSSTEV